METSLHRELKLRYAGPGAQTEVRLGRYRVDAVADGELIEIQNGTLSSIWAKITNLLADHRVRIVKPIVREKLLIKRRRRGGRIVYRRRSPKRGRMLDIFQELVYFTRVFPHPRLSIEAVLVDVEEYRYPGHGRRRRRRHDDFQVEDQLLVSTGESCLLHTAADLIDLLDCQLPDRFHTGELAAALGEPRWIAQRIAYCLRQTGAVRVAAKQRNAIVYEVVPDRAATDSRAA